MNKVLMFLAVLPVMASAQISEGMDTLAVPYSAQGVNFNTGVKTSFQNLSPPHCFLPCSTIITSADLVTCVNMLCVCSCPEVNPYAIGSSQPFYIAKQNFTSMNLSKTLSLNDTTLFAKVDTADSTPRCMPISGTASSDSVKLLPYVEVYSGPASGSISFDIERVFVLETSQQKYALVRVTPFTTLATSDCMQNGPEPPDTFVTNGGTALHWYIQNNGTLDFSGVDQSAVLPHNANPILRVASQNQRYRVGLASSITNRQIREVYTLEGKRINAGALKKMNELVIYR